MPKIYSLNAPAILHDVVRPTVTHPQHPSYPFAVAQQLEQLEQTCQAYFSGLHSSERYRDDLEELAELVSFMPNLRRQFSAYSPIDIVLTDVPTTYEAERILPRQVYVAHTEPISGLTRTDQLGFMLPSYTILIEQENYSILRRLF